MAPAMDLKLKGKVALVSGSTAGIGYAIAATLAREGAQSPPLTVDVAQQTALPVVVAPMIMGLLGADRGLRCRRAPRSLSHSIDPNR